MEESGEGMGVGEHMRGKNGTGILKGQNYKDACRKRGGRGNNKTKSLRRSHVKIYYFI